MGGNIPGVNFLGENFPGRGFSQGGFSSNPQKLQFQIQFVIFTHYFMVLKVIKA